MTVLSVLAEVKKLAKAYRRLTGRPLGVTGEIAEYEAAQLLGLELCAARQSGYDATRKTAAGLSRLQIKGRCLLPNAKPGQRLGRIQLDKEWDAVLLVLLNEDFEATAIYEAPRHAVEAALNAPGSRARNENGALPVTKFKAIGKKIWPTEPTDSRTAK